MKLGVISDTHGEIELTRAAAMLFRDRAVAAVLHCGDIGHEGIVSALDGLVVHYVFGNCDTRQSDLREAIERQGQHCHGIFGHLRYEGRKIFFLHGHQIPRYQSELESGRWDLICSGHTHEKQLHFEFGTLQLNPGALHRVARPTVAIVALPELDVEFFTL